MESFAYTARWSQAYSVRRHRFSGKVQIPAESAAPDDASSPRVFSHGSPRRLADWLARPKRRIAKVTRISRQRRRCGARLFASTWHSPCAAPLFVLLDPAPRLKTNNTGCDAAVRRHNGACSHNYLLLRCRIQLDDVRLAAGAATGVAIGLLTSGLFLYTATNPNAGASASLSQPVAALGPVTFEIVPSPVIDTNGQFFFGTGDGSAGYYSERPVQ